jgi:hypothetical protein
MRSLASLVAREAPDVLAVCEIDPGDALSVATRFALQWAYRGRQALFWRDVLAAREVHDVYLPVRPERPFERRGFIRVDAMYNRRECALVTTQFSSDRNALVPELRFVRTQLRRVARDAVVFVHLRDRAIAFEDLGFRNMAIQSGGADRVYVRGFESAAITAVAATV